MIISHSKKIIFIHNYKVAGTSIQNALESYNNPTFKDSNYFDKIKIILGLYPQIFSNQFTGHIQAKELKKKLPSSIFDKYFKFGFVRNPWDWQVSLYNYMLKTETHHQHKLIKSMKNFDEYIEWRVNNELRLQKDFFYDEDKCLMNFIGKLENLENDFVQSLTRIDITEPLRHLNSSRKKNDSYIKYYSQKSIDLVHEAFIKDIKLFGYLKPEKKTLQLPWGTSLLDLQNSCSLRALTIQ